MNIKNKRKLFIIVAVIIVVISILILTIIFTSNKDTNQLLNSDLLYCNGNCYSYDGERLAYFVIHEPDEDVDEKELKYTCKIDEDCTEEILEEGDDYLIIKKDDSVDAFITDNYKYKSTDNISLKGKFYANNNVELYFISDKVLIIGLKDGSQKRENYSIEDYVGNYAEFNISSASSLISNTDFVKYYPDIYNVKTDEILGYTKSDINSAKYIDTSFYDENGEIKSDPKYIISGAYSSKSTEVVIKDNKAIIGNEDEVIKTDFIVSDANKKYVQYRTDSIDFIYNFETKELCFVDIDKDSCYKPSDESNFKYIKQ